MRAFIFLLYLLSLCGVVCAQELTDEYWQTRYDQVCGEGQAQFCDRLKNSNGTWVKPKRNLVEVLTRSSASIRDIATKFDLDPRMIVAPILVENSLNVQVDDEIQNFLVGAGVLSSGEVMGRTMSIGLGQINVSAAIEIEPLVARIEGREMRSQQEVARALLTPEGAFTYAAGIAKHVIDLYKEKGIDISDKPEVVATLYNIGRYEERVERTVSEGRQPGVNYFGLFAEKNMKIIDNIISGTETMIQDEPSWFDQSLHFFGIGGRDIYLRSKPDQCSTAGRGNSGLYNRSQSLIQHEVVAVSSDINDHEKLGEAYGCDAEKWILIRDEDGNVGWIKEGSFVYPPVSSISIGFFERRGLNSCSNELKRKFPDQFIESSDGQLVFKFLSEKESGEVDWTKPNHNEYACGSGPQNNGFAMGGPGMGGPAMGIPAPASSANSKAELERRFNIIKNFKTAVMSKLQISDWNSSSNPYKLAFGEEASAQQCQSLEQRFANGSFMMGAPNPEAQKYMVSCQLQKIERCLAGSIPCNADNVTRLMFNDSAFTVKDRPSFQDLTNISQQLAFLNYMDYRDPDSDKWNAEVKQLAIQTIERCQEVFDSLPNLVRMKDIFKTMHASATDIEEGAIIPGYYGGFGAGGVGSAREALSQHLESLDRMCQDVKMILAPANQSISSDINCNPNIIESDLSNNMGISSEILRTMISQNPSGFEDNLEQRISALATLYPLRYPSSMQNNGMGMSAPGNFSQPEEVAEDPLKCSYDPFKNSELIQKILEVDCVKRAYVPDPWLVNQAVGKPKDVIYKERRDTDKFVIELR